MKFKKTTALILVLLICFITSGCTQSDTGKIKIVTTLFPQYDFVRQICGDLVEVSLLLDPGVESHSFDPTTRDIQSIQSADLFIYTGEEMEPWVGEVLKSLENQNLKFISLSSFTELLTHEHHDDEEHDEHNENDEHDEHKYDPHVWLDMKNAVKAAQGILKSICEIDPDNKAVYEKNAASLVEKLEYYDGEFNTAVCAAADKTVVFGGRFAYYYFVSAYNLKYKTVFDSCSTDVEPSAKTVTEITNFVKENNIKYIFHEELADPKVARSIAEATGAQLLEFSTAHNLSKTDFDAGVTFCDIMERDLTNLKTALEG